jgi:hypothetical protein
MFSDVFASGSDTCFKCFIYLQMYVASAASGCFKVDQNAAHVARAPMAREQRPTTGFPSSRGAPRPLLYSPFPSLPSISKVAVRARQGRCPRRWRPNEQAKVMAPGGPTMTRCLRGGPVTSWGPHHPLATRETEQLRAARPSRRPRTSPAVSQILGLF